MAAKLTDILTAVKTKITDLNLEATDLLDANVEIHKVPVFTQLTIPAVVITPLGSEGINVNPMKVTGKDTIDYSVLWAIVDKDKQNQTLNFDRNLQWREDILGAFLDDLRLGSVTGIIERTIQPLPIIDPALWREKSIYFSGAICTFTWHKTRS